MAPNGICGTMQQLRANYTARQLAIDVDVFGVYHIANSHFGTAGFCSLIYAFGYRNVVVFINNAGGYKLAGGIYGIAVGAGEVFSYRRNFSGTDNHICISENTLRLIGPNGSVFQQEVFLHRNFFVAISNKRKHYFAQIFCYIGRVCFCFGSICLGSGFLVGIPGNPFTVCQLPLTIPHFLGIIYSARQSHLTRSVFFSQSRRGKG